MPERIDWNFLVRVAQGAQVSAGFGGHELWLRHVV
jgi:hypothetical protein